MENCAKKENKLENKIIKMRLYNVEEVIFYLIYRSMRKYLRYRGQQDLIGDEILH